MSNEEITILYKILISINNDYYCNLNISIRILKIKHNFLTIFIKNLVFRN